jgi:hypothetical protein
VEYDCDAARLLRMSIKEVQFVQNGQLNASPHMQAEVQIFISKVKGNKIMEKLRMKYFDV